MMFQQKPKFNLTLLSLILGVFSFLFILTSFFQVYADEATITASIPDRDAPSTPILISPSDEALISDATPEFSWYESTDDVLMSHYILLIDGSDLYGNLPLTTYENSDYSLTYDSTNGIYSLVPKSNLSDGDHSWKVTAYDFGSHSTASDTWDFEIDTLAPSFTISKIGDKSVNISAQDSSSVPTDPIEIFANDATANEPIIIASGEASSSVALTVTIPGDPNQNFSQSIDSSGNWELKLGILPRDTIIELDFIITDLISHVSVLENLYIIISQSYFPTTPTPTTVPTSTISPVASPSTSVSPGSTVSSDLSSDDGVEDSGIQIPIIPPREIVHELAQEISERLPEKVAIFLSYLFSSEFWKKIANYFALIILILLPIISYILILTKFIEDFSLVLLKKILFLVLPFGEAKKNLVFDYRKIEASPLVKVELIDQETGELIDFKISNYWGNFTDFAWPIARVFKLRIRDKNYYYPIGDKKPVQLSKEQFYQDEILQFKNQDNDPIMIPTLMAQGQDSVPLLESLRVFSLYLLTYPYWFFFISFLPVLIITLRYPSIINTLALIYYAFVFSKKFSLSSSKSDLNLRVVNESGQKFSARIVLSIFDLQSKESFSLTLPVSFSILKTLKLKRGQYLMTAFSFNYSQWDQQNAVSRQRILISDEAKKLEIEFKRIEFSDNKIELLKPLSKI